jgi:hypothetical protein
MVEIACALRRGLGFFSTPPNCGACELCNGIDITTQSVPHFQLHWKRKSGIICYLLGFSYSATNYSNGEVINLSNPVTICSRRPTYHGEVGIGCLLQPMSRQHMSLIGRSGHAMAGSSTMGDDLSSNQSGIAMLASQI